MSKLILVADDNKGYAALLESALVSRGYQVVKAYDGLKAVELAKQLSPDLILLDVQMPKMDGDQVYMTLRENGALTQRIPILMITALRTEEEIEENHEENIFAKPVPQEKLLAKIKEMIG